MPRDASHAAGGYCAAFVTLQTLGPLPITASAASHLDLPHDAGKGVKVVVFGAGIAGLVAAYEMGEGRLSSARCWRHAERPGGRDSFKTVGENRQIAPYITRNYFNADAAINAWMEGALSAHRALR